MFVYNNLNKYIIMAFESNNIDKLLNNRTCEKIYLINQFYIDAIPERQHEIVSCLRKNLELQQITQIFLLNEKIYNEDELGISDLSNEHKEKIQQIVITKRLTYKDALLFIKKMNDTQINGYYIIANSDIFFDNSLENLQITSLSMEKSLYALLRFEYNENYKEDLSQSKLSGPYKTSQDTWIIHSNFCPSINEMEKCNFNLGVPGCDNVIAYLFDSFGYKIYNEPFIIRTYHFHCTQIRNHSEKNRLPRPYLFLYPIFRNQNIVKIINEAT